MLYYLDVELGKWRVDACIHPKTIILFFYAHVFSSLPVCFRLRERSPGCFWIPHMVYACEVLEEAAAGLKMLVCQALSALMSGL